MSGVQDRLRRQERRAGPMVTNFGMICSLLLPGILFAALSATEWSGLGDGVQGGGWHDAAHLLRMAFGIGAAACVSAMAASIYAIWSGRRLPDGGAAAVLLSGTRMLAGAMIPVYVAFVLIETWTAVEHAGLFYMEREMALLALMSSVGMVGYAITTCLALNMLRIIYSLEDGR